MTAVRMDLTALFDAISSQNEIGVISEITKGLIEEIQPSKIAGRLGIAAALGDPTGTAVPALVAAGRIGDWIRVIPPGPETGAEQRQILLPAVPLVAAALFAGPAIKHGLNNQKLTLPDPLFPKDVTHPEGAWGALRDALKARDTTTFARILMGFYGSGTDYRDIEGSLYFAVNGNFAADGVPLLALTKATQQLDAVEWGDRVPILLQWLIPLMVHDSAEPEGAKTVRDAIGQPEQSLDFARVRIRIVNPDAAGTELRQRIAKGSTRDVIDAIFAALKAGANGPLIATQTCLAAAEHLENVPTDDATLFNAALTAVRVANSARLAVTHVQDIRVLPIIFQAANLVNQTVTNKNNRVAQPVANTTSSPLIGGLIEYGVLRNIERQATVRDESGTRASLRRYTQMAFPGRSLAGTLGLVASRTDIASDANGRAMLAVQATGEDYLALTLQQQATDGISLMDAALRVIMAQQGSQALAQQIEQTTGTALVGSNKK